MATALPLADISKFHALTLTLVEEVAGGFRSKNYILTDGNKKYFLKKHRNGDEAQVQSVCLAEQFFAEGGVPVILPIRTKQGEAFFEHDSELYSLYPFVNGRHIERGKLTKPAAISLGAALATLHQRGKNSSLPAAEQFHAWDTDEFLADVAAIEAAIQKNQAQSDFDAMALKSIRLKRRVVLEENLQYDALGLHEDHLIHGDYFCDNVFFGDNDTVSHVFDFERVQYAPPLYELFRSMFVTFLSIPSQENVSLAKDYVAAYLAAYPFPKTVIKNSLAAAYQKQMQSLWIEGGHYLDGSTRADSLLPSQYACNHYYAAHRTNIEAYLLG